MVPVCRIELLGALRVRQGARVISRFRTQKTGALLACLAYSRRPQPRELLIERHWPEADLSTGRNNLSLALSSLRRQLEPPDVPAGAVLQADRLNVQLNPAAVSTDVAEFETLLQSAWTAESSAAARQLLQQAVEQYGGPLLPAYYEEWILPERERLTEAYLGALRELVRCLVEASEYPPALDYARRAVDIDPLSEAAHRELISLYVKTGRREAALRQYRELERILAEELNWTPSEPTRALLRPSVRERTGGGRDPAVAALQTDRSIAPRERTPASVRPEPAPADTLTLLLTEVYPTGKIPGEWEQNASRREAGVTALASADALFRWVFRQYGGRELKGAGGAFTVAFANPTAAVRCAIQAQQTLEAHCWPAQTAPLRLRMALRTGPVTVRDGGCEGAVLAQAPRVLAAAGGGQILCSESTAVLLGQEPGEELLLAELGYHVLPGLDQAERLFRVEYPGMPASEFTPSTAAYPAPRLPLRITRFFGREAEVASLSGLILSPETRLVTLTGAGGSGKTRLALETAGRLLELFCGAVWFVSLQEVAHAGLIPSALRSALGLSDAATVDPMVQVAALLSRRPGLLVLDNFEHLVEEGAAVVQELLAGVPGLKCLVTSRRALSLAGEQVFAVLPLPVPDPEDGIERLAACPSVQLLVDRAQAGKPDFQLTEGRAAPLAELCRRLDGIPLALELAAARIPLLTPAQILSHLNRRLDFLTSRRRDLPPRHQTLRATVEWSYQLLSPELQRFFAGLSVFRGGWSLEAAEAILEEPRALDRLAELCEVSLIFSEERAAGARFRMLETLREYAWERLAPAERAAVRQRHAHYYRRLAAASEPALQGPAQAEWLKRLDAELENFRAALAWCAAESADCETGLSLAGALAPFWRIRGHFTEGRGWLDRLLSCANGRESQTARAKGCGAVGLLAWRQGSYAAARSALNTSLVLYQALEDSRGVATALFRLGCLELNEGNLEAARAQADASLALLDGSEVPEKASVLGLLALIAYNAGDHAAAEPLYEEARRLHEALGNRTGTAIALHGLALLAGRRGETSRKSALLERCHQIWQELESKPGLASVYMEFAALLLDEGDYSAAVHLISRAIRIRWALGDLEALALSLGEYAEALGCLGVHEPAVRLLGSEQALRERIGAPRLPDMLPTYAVHVERARGDLSEQQFTAAFEAGRALTLEEAVEFALGQQPGSSGESWGDGELRPGGGGPERRRGAALPVSVHPCGGSG